jgi:hypothetical protein
MSYTARLAVALFGATAGFFAGGCADALSSPRLSAVPAVIRTPELAHPTLEISRDCDLAVTNDPACNNQCDSASGCDGGTGDGSGGEPNSTTHVTNESTVVSFTNNGVMATAQATFSGNYYMQSVTARAFRDGREIGTITTRDESNETQSPFTGFVHVTKTSFDPGVRCGVTANAHGVHRAETRLWWPISTIGLKEKGSNADPISKPPCQTTDESTGNGGGGGGDVITCIYSLRYVNGVLVSETLLSCV